MKVSENKVAFFDGLYRSALEKQGDLFERLDKAYAQYRGSGETDGGRSAETVRNITYELVESQISTEIPAPSVRTLHASSVKEKNAKRIETLLASLRDRLPFEKLNDTDERYTYIYGGSIFLVEWDDSLSSYGEVGSVKISGISPRAFVGQPGITAVEDMEYCFLQFTTTFDELARRYGLLSSDESLLEKAVGCDDAVSAVVCFYKNEKGLVSRFIWSGEKVLSDTDDYYGRKVKICKHCGAREGSCLCGKGDFALVSEEFETLPDDVIRSDESVIPKSSRIVFYRPKGFPLVVRKNVSLENSYLGQSDPLTIRPQQLEINKVLSRVHEKLMMSGVFPYKPDDCQFRYDNSIGGKVLNLRPGELPNQFGILDTTPRIAEDLAYVEATYKDAKRILGITDAFVGGDDATGQSGKAREIQVAQSEGRLVSKRMMKNAAYADLDRLLFEMFLAYADEPRLLLYRDGYGNAESDAFCRYDFLEYDSEKGIYVYDDDYLFSVAAELPSKDEREPLWEKNLTNYREGTFGTVGEAKTLARYWAAQVYCGYPGARDHLAFFLNEGEKTEAV